MPQTAYIHGFLVLLTGGGFIWMMFRGLFEPDTFADAPKRCGGLTPGDLLITVGLWIVGQGVGAMLVKPLLSDDQTARDMLLVSTAAFVCVLPMLGFVVVRSRAAFDEKLAGLGLRFDRPIWSTWQTFKVTAYIIPATMMTMLVLGIIVTDLGYELPRIAHGILKHIAESDDRLAVVGLCVVAVVGAPIVEEVIFRGVLQSALRHLLPEANRWWAIMIASVVFALIHIGSVVPVTLVVALPAYVVLAMGLGYVYEKTGRLWAPIFIHAAFNGLSILTVFLQQAYEVAP